VAPRENCLNCGWCGPIVEMRKEITPYYPSMRPPSDLKTNLPKGPMPVNVRDFKLIELRFTIALILLFFKNMCFPVHPKNFSLMLLFEMAYPRMTNSFWAF
jgi:hypothetical protein